jgi:hypothetical protein
VSASDALPEALRRRLDGRDLGDKVGETFLLCTVGEPGWPHVAMLSAGELLAVSPRELRVALHEGSGTSANVERTGRATLLAVLDGAAWTVRLDAVPLGRHRAGGIELRLLSAKVAEVTEHRVPYAELETGVRFRLTDAGGALARWRETLTALRGAGCA